MASCSGKLILLLCCASFLFAQENIKTVQGNGGGTATDGGNILRGTFGQNVTGRKFAADAHNNVGFWYGAFRKLKDIDAGAIVTIPSSEGEIGDTVEIPLMLVGSNKLKPYLPLKFEATVRFNATILFPLDPGQDCGQNEICEIKVTGTATDTAGILAIMKFQAKLGAVTVTDMEITDFHWTEINSPVIKKNGFFQLNGVCEVDGVVRLIKRTHEAGLLNIYPNPAAEKVRLGVAYREKGIHSFILVDRQGNTVREFTRSVNGTGQTEEELPLDDIPSGSYTLLMMTPNELFVNKLQVVK